MSFTTASAILRGRWLIDKAWAHAHMPLVFSFIKGDAHAAKTIMGSDWDDDEPVINDRPSLVNGTDKVYEVCPNTDLSKLPAGCIAYIDIDGPMLKDGDMCSWGMSDYAMLLDGLRTSQNVAGVIMDIDSPGGQVDGTATLADAIAACDAVKPVIGFVDDGMSASAAYWCISACREVFVSQQTDQVGSIGVYCTVADWYKYYESLGLSVKDVYSTLSDDKNLDYRQSVAGNDDLLKAELDVIANAFIGTVKKNRKGKLNGADWATGKMYFPSEAQQLGLIDGVKSFSQVVFRISRLISSINKFSNNNTMAFEKTLAIAKAEAFAVTDEGFAMSEEHLNNIEAAIALHESNVDELAAANGTVEQLNTTISEMHIEATANAAKINTQSARITELEAQVAALGKAPSGSGSTLVVEKDETVEEKPAPSYASDNNPANAWVDRQLRNKKAVSL
jgi:ClpP class serine protease